MQGVARPISLAGSELSDVRHVCALFNSDDEEYRTLLPFIHDGLECGDKAVHIVNPAQSEDHLRRLAAHGIDTTAVTGSGQLEVKSSTDTYLRDGRFDSERMLTVFRQLASTGTAVGRFVCRMDWAAEGRTHVDQLIEFESRVNDIWRRSNDVVICTYDLARFSGDAVIDVVRTHPYVIIGGALRQNPFFVTPEQFLPELRSRRGRELTCKMGN